MRLSNAKSLLISLLIHSIIFMKNLNSIPLAKDKKLPSKTSDRYPSIWGGFCGNELNENSPNVVDFHISTTTTTTRLQQSNTIAYSPQSIIKETRQVIPFDQGNLHRGRAEMLKNNLVHIKLNIIYDSTMAEQYTENKMEMFIRNIVYATQLIFEQPEMYQIVKLNFVVINISKSKLSYSSGLSNGQVLDHFAQGQDISYLADLNILFVFRNLWFEKSKSFLGVTTFSKVFGIAYTDTFCNPNGSPQVILVNAASINVAIVLAHEMAHSLSSHHDGSNSLGELEKKCSDNNFIMSPYSGPYKLTWSNCTVQVIFNNLLKKYNCVYDETRLNTSKPFKPMFDFSPQTPNNSWRTTLPGQSFTIDQQCNEIIGYPAISSLKKFGRNADGLYTTCQNLACAVESTQFYIGPAVMGSECQLSGGGGSGLHGDIGICVHSLCVGHY